MEDQAPGVLSLRFFFLKKSLIQSCRYSEKIKILYTLTAYGLSLWDKLKLVQSQIKEPLLKPSDQDRGKTRFYSFTSMENIQM